MLVTVTGGSGQAANDLAAMLPLVRQTVKGRGAGGAAAAAGSRRGGGGAGSDDSDYTDDEAVGANRRRGASADAGSGGGGVGPDAETLAAAQKAAEAAGGKVVGVFHMKPYMEGGKCIEYDGELISRSAFERVGGSTMAKWYRSIKVWEKSGRAGRVVGFYGVEMARPESLVGW